MKDLSVLLATHEIDILEQNVVNVALVVLAMVFNVVEQSIP